MIRTFMTTLCLCAGLLLPAGAKAHKPSDAYLTLTADQDTIAGQWDIALRDLEHAIGLDRDGDGAVTWGELRANHAAIAAYALPRLKLSADGRACKIRPSGQLVDAHSDGAYTVLPFTTDCPIGTRSLEVAYSLFFELDPQHRGLLRVEIGEETVTGILSPERPGLEIALGAPNLWRQIVSFMREGVWHIWIGFDHILFLVALLLPATLVRQDGRWRTVQGFAPALCDVAKTVTAFTFAHSVTLTLAVLEFVALPSRLVESAIAASVVLAALNNVFPLVTRRLWLVAFGFGLIHGFGFASVLADLGLRDASLLISLFSFNLGVEIGQLAIVAGLLPLLYLAGRSALYPRFFLRFGSAAIGAVAALWLIERALGLALMT
jgi:hypothetical protein